MCIYVYISKTMTVYRDVHVDMDPQLNVDFLHHLSFAQASVIPLGQWIMHVAFVNVPLRTPSISYHKLIPRITVT